MRLKKKKRRGYEIEEKMLKRLCFTVLGLNVKNLYEI